MPITLADEALVMIGCPADTLNLIKSFAAIAKLDLQTDLSRLSDAEREELPSHFAAIEHNIDACVSRVHPLYYSAVGAPGVRLAEFMLHNPLPIPSVSLPPEDGSALTTFIRNLKLCVAAVRKLDISDAAVATDRNVNPLYTALHACDYKIQTCLLFADKELRAKTLDTTADAVPTVSAAFKQLRALKNEADELALYWEEATPHSSSSSSTFTLFAAKGTYRGAAEGLPAHPMLRAREIYLLPTATQYWALLLSLLTEWHIADNNPEELQEKRSTGSAIGHWTIDTPKNTTPYQGPVVVITPQLAPQSATPSRSASSTPSVTFAADTVFAEKGFSLGGSNPDATDAQRGQHSLSEAVARNRMREGG